MGRFLLVLGSVRWRRNINELGSACVGATSMPVGRGAAAGTRASILGALLGHHHFQELLVVYEPVLVLVDLAYELVDLLVGHGLVLALQAEPEFLGADGARVVFVEVLEGLPYLLLLRVVLGVHAGRDELGVVDHAVVVRVDHLHRLLDVVDRQLYFRHRLDALLQLLVGQLTVAIFIEFSERRP